MRSRLKPSRPLGFSVKVARRLFWIGVSMASVIVLAAMLGGGREVSLAAGMASVVTDPIDTVSDTHASRHRIPTAWDSGRIGALPR